MEKRVYNAHRPAMLKTIEAFKTDAKWLDNLEPSTRSWPSKRSKAMTAFIEAYVENIVDCLEVAVDRRRHRIAQIISRMNLTERHAILGWAFAEMVNIGVFKAKKLLWGTNYIMLENNIVLRVYEDRIMYVCASKRPEVNQVYVRIDGKRRSVSALYKQHFEQDCGEDITHIGFEDYENDDWEDVLN